MKFSRQSISIKSLMLCTFTPNKSYGYLLNVEPNNLVLMKTYSIASDYIKITFADHNVRLLEIEN